MVVTIKTSRFKQEYYHPHITVNLSHATDDRLFLVKRAMHGLEQIYREGKAYKHAGVMLLNIVPEQKFIPDLLADQQQISERKLLTITFEKINNRFGRDAISIGSCNFKNRSWAMSQAHCSPSYLSNWDDIITVH